MLIIEELNRLHPEVESVVEQLYQKAYENQQHEQDLLLVIENAAYEKEYDRESVIISPYVIGPQYSGLAYAAIYEYLHGYRQEYIIDKEVLDQGLNSNNPEEKNYWEKYESLAVQLGLYAYLKFWESDFVIRQLYQLTNLICGESYDWHLNFDDEKSRQNTIRIKIRNRLQKVVPQFSELLRNSYKPQLRNAIAHSLYYFIGRSIHFINYRKNPGDDINRLDFESLRTYLHYTFLLFNELIVQRKKWNRAYGGKALKNEEFLEVLITKKKIEERAFKNLRYYPENDRWGYQQ